VVKDASGRNVLRNVNRLDEPEKHTTFGWARDLGKGSTSCLAFEVAWEDFKPKGWSLVAQQQHVGSPVWAISNDARDGHWFGTIRLGAKTIKVPLGPLVLNRWETFVVACHADDRGSVDIWRSTDIAKAPVHLSGDTWQGTTGHHTLGIYAERASSGALVARFGPSAAGSTPAEAVAEMELAA
jgi:hypothetical protein